jgi:hypothetical protein
MHDLGDRRSLALHRAIAELLVQRPEILELARARVRRWRETGEVARFYADAWQAVLDGDPAEVAAFLEDGGERAIALRHVTPFAGVIDPRTRWRIWREVRERAERG